MTKVISTKNILGGKKRISGTRISVDLVASYLTNGNGVKDIKESYPHLTNKQIFIALEYLDNKIHKEKIKLGSSTT